MYVLRYSWVEVAYVPNGAGPMSQASAQVVRLQPQPPGNYPAAAVSGAVAGTLVAGAGGGWPVGPGPVGIVVPGGDTPTQANFRTALTGTSTAPVGGQTGSLAGDIDAQIAAQLGRIQGFATGSG
jgi:hypothetical protein